MQFIKNIIDSYKNKTNKHVQLCEMYCGIILKKDNKYLFIEENEMLNIPEYNIDNNIDFKIYITSKLKQDYNLNIKLNGILKIQYVTLNTGCTKMKVLFEGRIIGNNKSGLMELSYKDICNKNITFKRKYIKDFIIEYSDKTPYPVNIISQTLKPISYENKLKKKIYKNIDLYKKGKLKLNEKQYQCLLDKFNSL